MLNKLDVNMCSGSMGCGIYEVGTSQTRMFITDGGRVLPVEGHHITAEDLMTVFVWGMLEEAKREKEELKRYAMLETS